MARIKIDFPEPSLFRTQLTVRVNDLNYGGHVGNDTILTLMHEARFQFLRSMGFPDEVNLEGPIGIVVADAAVVYKAEAFHGDIITIDVSINDHSKYGFDMFYRLVNQKDKEVAIGKTGIVCMNYDTRKLASIPGPLLQQLNIGG